MCWVVYIIRCADNTLYTGITKDLEKRISAHNQGKAARYTRGRQPVTLVYQESCNNQSLALKRERTIKALSKSKKLSLIQAAC